ncbi:MAG: uroporphyrinogen-III synthase [Pseudomonadota bacterium]
MNSQTLKGLLVLVTRPRAQARLWSQLLCKAGAQVQLVPMLAIKALVEPEHKQGIKNKILQLDEYQKAIFVSQNAVSYGIDWIDQYWPQLPEALEFFAVGKTTGEQLQQQSSSRWGKSVIAAEHAMNSEALVALANMQRVDNEKILIFRGLGGRTYMGDVLRSRNAKVDYCELYQRTIPDTIDWSALDSFKASANRKLIAVHSAETLDNLCSLVDDKQWLLAQPLLVPGERVALHANDAGFKTIVTADNATDNSMIGALYDWRKTV